MTKVVLRVLSVSITVLLSVLVVCGLYQIGLKCYDFGYRVYTEPAVGRGDGTDKLVQITDEMGIGDIAELLEEKGLVRDAKLFYLQAKLAGFKKKTGVYTLNTAMTARELMAALAPPEEEAEEDDS